MFDARAVKQLAGSGSVYVRLTKELCQSVTVTDSSSEDDITLPSFGIGRREQMDPQDDSSSSDGMRERSPPEDPIHLGGTSSAHGSDHPTSSGEHTAIWGEGEGLRLLLVVTTHI